MNDKILLLCGKSGSGKTTVAGVLERDYGMKQVESYTDRPMRVQNEKGHVFITPEEFDLISQDKMVAYTEFAGHRYCATYSQIEDCDIYVIDPKGIEEFMGKYHGGKTSVAIYLAAPESLLATRMAGRGDSLYSIMERINHDREAFRDMRKVTNHRVMISPGKTPEKIAEEIVRILDFSKAGRETA